MTTDAHTVRTDGQARNESPTGREGLVSTICKNSFVVETPHISYGALPRTSFQQLREARNESPTGREGLVSTICKNAFVAETPHISYDALPKTSFQQLREARNESPNGREGLVSTICKNPLVAKTSYSSYGALPKTSSPQLRRLRNESPGPLPLPRPPLPRGNGGAASHLTPLPRSPTIELAVLDGELAVPCTRNPPQRGRIPPQGLAQRPLLVQSGVEGRDPRDGRP